MVVFILTRVKYGSVKFVDYILLDHSADNVDVGCLPVYIIIINIPVIRFSSRGKQYQRFYVSFYFNNTQ